MEGLHFRVLGPTEVWQDGSVRALPARRLRALLTELLINANRVGGQTALTILRVKPNTATLAGKTHVRTMTATSPATGPVLFCKLVTNMPSAKMSAASTRGRCSPTGLTISMDKTGGSSSPATTESKITKQYLKNQENSRMPSSMPAKPALMAMIQPTENVSTSNRGVPCRGRRK